LIAHDSPQFIPERQSTGGYPAVAFNGTGAGLRASALDEVGYFPWGYFMMYLELHLCTRLLEAGWEVNHFPEIEVWHSRSSGSSYPERSFYGQRNYYWYVWEFYPWQLAVFETMHEIAFRFKLVMRGKLSLLSSILASIAAIRGGPGILKVRRPVSRDVLDNMRSVRQCGNWHSKAPEFRQYSG
jgi:GT2 family glycosyltransferase